MSRKNPKGKWVSGRLFQLELRAPDMTIAELADWFDETPECIRRTCKYYGISHKGSQTVRRERQTTKPLSAQESIDLFKLQYQNELFNQLLTKKWSQHEQIRIN